MANQWLNASAGPILIKDISSRPHTPHPKSTIINIPYAELHQISYNICRKKQHNEQCLCYESFNSNLLHANMMYANIIETKQLSTRWKLRGEEVTYFTIGSFETC